MLDVYEQIKPKNKKNKKQNLMDQNLKKKTF